MNSTHKINTNVFSNEFGTTEGGLKKETVPSICTILERGGQFWTKLATPISYVFIFEGSYSS